MYTENGIKVLLYCEQGTNKYTDVRPEHRVQPALAHTASVEHHKEVQLVTPDLIQHTQYCHRSTTSNVHSKTHPARKRTPMTTRSSSLSNVGSRAPHWRTVLQNGQEKNTKASPKKQSIMEYSPGLPHDTNFLRSWSGNPGN